MTAPTSQPSQEYPIRALVAVSYYRGVQRGTIIAAKKDDRGSGYTSHDPNSPRPFEWLGPDLIIDPSPAQIAEERAKAGLPAEPSEGKKDLEPVREDAHRSPSGSERIYRTPAGLLLRMLQIGEVVQKGDFTWLKQGSVEESDPILAGAGVGRTVTAEMGNNYYRPIQGAADGEAVPEAPAEGSPSLPSADAIEKAFRAGFDAGREYGLDSASWDSMRHSDHPDEDKALGEYLAALSKLEGK